MSPEKANKVMQVAVMRAMTNGWQLPFEEPVKSVSLTQEDVNGTYQTEPYVKFELDGMHDWCVGVPHLLFDIGFAKALWPGYIDLATSKVYDTPQAGVPTAPLWKVNLQMLVVSEQRMRFLAKAIGYEAN